MKTKITLITLVFTLFAVAYFFSIEIYETRNLQNNWLSEATEHVSAAWNCEISDCQTDEDVYAHLAGDH